MGHHNHKEHTAEAWAFLVIGVGLLFFAIYGMGGLLEAPAQQYLDLSPKDLVMIPVGGAVFIVFWLMMDKALFRPFVTLSATREELTQGAEVSAATAKEQTAQLEAEYEEKLTDARVKGMQEKAKILGVARKEAQTALDEASSKSIDDIAAAREGIAKEGEALKEQLLNQSDELISAVVEKVTSSPEPVKNVRS